MSNLLEVICRVINNPIIEIKDYYSSRNRATQVGEALENYLQDLFADSFTDEDPQERMRKHNSVFSYIGNQSNPPDLMLKGGDAIETKKVEHPNSALALNSSYPKSKLHSSNSLLTESCRNCEEWMVKDIIYAIGHTTNTSLKYLWLVYGDCFAASPVFYERFKEKISQGVNEIPGVEFTPTNELGKVKRVDPLGITDLRIRGMWHIDNPHKFFSYLNCSDNSATFQLFSLMRSEKFYSFPESSQTEILSINNENFAITDVTIQDPDNPAKLIDAKLFIFRLYNSIQVGLFDTILQE